MPLKIHNIMRPYCVLDGNLPIPIEWFDGPVEPNELVYNSTLDLLYHHVRFAQHAIGGANVYIIAIQGKRQLLDFWCDAVIVHERLDAGLSIEFVELGTAYGKHPSNQMRKTYPLARIRFQ